MPEGVVVERVQVAAASGSGPEGGNSAWILPDSGVVVDPGPPGDAAFESLETGIHEACIGLDDVETVLVTHWHVDHAGLAPRVAEAADATLAMHERDAPLVREYAVEREARVARDTETLVRWGVPEERVDRLRDADSPSPMPDAFPVDALADGDRVGPLEVRHTPGHTAGHVAFVVDEADDADGDDDADVDCGSRRALVGDALLRTITPNVGGGDTRQTQPLAAYRETLDVLESVADRALPGHGTAFALAPRVAELRAHHRERAALVYDSLAVLAATEPAGSDAAGGDGTDGDTASGERDGATPWQVARERFGDMDGYHVKFGAGEAYAHLADLASAGLVEQVERDPLRYRALDADATADPDTDSTAVLDATWSVEDD